MEVGMLAILDVIFGGALLLAGRKLFWLFVGAIGFAIGIQFATRFFHGSEWMTIFAGLVLGVIFAVLAIFVESIAIALAGFLGGGYILLYLMGLIGLDKGVWNWAAFMIGGIIGLAVIAFLFDWALITISSLAGASMVISGINIARATAGIVFLVLFFAGVLIQGSELRKSGPSRQRTRLITN
jgi:hypothetical protein